MNKKTIIILILVVILVLFIPVPKYLNDGGSVEYNAIIYNVTKYHKLEHVGDENKYIDGISIRIFGKEVYKKIDESNVLHQTNASNGKVIIAIDKITNSNLLDNFIDNTNIYNEGRKSDKVEIISYTIEGDEILTTIEYDKENNKIIIVEDNTNDKFASEENRKVLTKEFEFPDYKLVKGLKDDYIQVSLISKDDNYVVISYNKKLEKEKDILRKKLKDLSIKAVGVSTEELVFYNNVLYGRSFSLIDYMANPNGPIDIINKLVGEEYLPTVNRETNTENLLNCYVDSVSGKSLVLLVDGCYDLYTAIDYKVEEENEIKVERSKENVKVEVLKDTITNDSAQILITDNNKSPYAWGQAFRIQKKENNQWKELKMIDENMGFIEIAYLLNEKNQLKLETKYAKYYGTLESGTYRIVKPVYDNGYIDIYSNEFEI